MTISAARDVTSARARDGVQVDERHRAAEPAHVFAHFRADL
jgi:hypothetical protein